MMILHHIAKKHQKRDTQKLGQKIPQELVNLKTDNG